MSDKKPIWLYPLITLVLLLCLIAPNLSCNRQRNDGVGGDWNPQWLNEDPLADDDIAEDSSNPEFDIEEPSNDNSSDDDDWTPQIIREDPLLDNEVDHRFWNSLWLSDDLPEIAYTYHNYFVDFDGSHGDRNDWEIYVMMADGTDQTNLSNHLSSDSYPVWSQDGQKIAFCSSRDSDDVRKHDLYVMNSDGSGLTRITEHRSDDHSPAWSPDGTKIAFVSNRYDNEDIYVIDSDGSNLLKITDDSAKSMFDRLDDTGPVWSPDGTKILYASWDVGNDREINVVDADGSGKINLAIGGCTPVWSPDGTKIAFFSNTDISTGGDIFVMNSDGTNQINLTNSTTNDRYPVWSPDGTMIAYTSFDGGKPGEIYVINADGTGRSNLTNHNHSDYSPAWSPDGTKIAFTSYRDGKSIYLMNTDGSEIIKLCDGTNPVWAP